MFTTMRSVGWTTVAISCHIPGAQPSIHVQRGQGITDTDAVRTKHGNSPRHSAGSCCHCLRSRVYIPAPESRRLRLNPRWQSYPFAAADGSSHHWLLSAPAAATDEVRRHALRRVKIKPLSSRLSVSWLTGTMHSLTPAVCG